MRVLSRIRHTDRLSGALLLAGVLAGFALPASVHASDYQRASTGNYLVEPNRDPGITLETATAIVRHRTGGRVLSAQPASRGAESGYQVRVLVDERLVQIWFVDHKGRIDSE
ncbi:MAG: PepSY domain-containing protein [Pseudomonadales bacterium]|nr:PepSY domain-containing protein [Pseudomonadales bacterium]MCP5183170.1 PepSY domain-containing protein [Pseudomonadales bacterium]